MQAKSNITECLSTEQFKMQNNLSYHAFIDVGDQLMLNTKWDFTKYKKSSKLMENGVLKLIYFTFLSCKL